MNICIQTPTIMDKERDWNNASVSIRLKAGDATRYWTVMDRAKKRNPYCDKSDVIKELLGLAKPSLLTKEDLHYFRTGNKSDLISVDDKGALDNDFPDIKDKRA